MTIITLTVVLLIPSSMPNRQPCLRQTLLAEPGMAESGIRPFPTTLGQAQLAAR